MKHAITLGLAVLALIVLSQPLAAQTTYQPTGDSISAPNIVSFFYTVDGNGMNITTNPEACTYGISYGPDAPDNPQGVEATGCSFTIDTNPDGSTEIYGSLPKATITLAVSGLQLTINPTTYHLHGVTQGRLHKYTMVSYSTSLIVQ